MHAEWFDPDHADRWQKCGVPDDLPFRTEPELAIEMVGNLVHRAEVPFRWVLGDERFGQNPAFLDDIQAMDKWYMVEVPANTSVWRRTPPVEPPGQGPLGRPRKLPRLAPSVPAAM